MDICVSDSVSTIEGGQVSVNLATSSFLLNISAFILRLRRGTTPTPGATLNVPEAGAVFYRTYFRSGLSRAELYCPCGRLFWNSGCEKCLFRTSYTRAKKRSYAGMEENRVFYSATNHFRAFIQDSKAISYSNGEVQNMNSTDNLPDNVLEFLSALAEFFE